jgi:mannose-1-phosphate guanylyltransferase
MNAMKSSLWGIVLAGGEGERLKEFVREHLGTDAPKQFCAFVGRRTMLERTVRRAGLLIPREQLVVIGTAHHGPYLFRSLANTHPGSVLLQPSNRDTAPGILFPLVHILKKDPHALVALFPSDHFVLPGRRLMSGVSQAADHLRHTNSTSPIILAAEATYPETEYGWIAPGAPVVSEKGTSVFRVNRFVEKPPHSDARRMLKDGWLWNTMVLVARATSLLELFRETVPDLVLCFKILQRFLGTDQEHVIANEVYGAIPSMNFSTTVLAPRYERLLVVPTRHVRWSDWGKKERILQTIGSLNYARAAIKVPPRDIVLPA